MGPSRYDMKVSSSVYDAMEISLSGNGLFKNAIAISEGTHAHLRSRVRQDTITQAMMWRCNMLVHGKHKVIILTETLNAINFNETSKSKNNQLVISRSVRLHQGHFECVRADAQDAAGKISDTFTFVFRVPNGLELHPEDENVPTKTFSDTQLEKYRRGLLFFGVHEYTLSSVRYIKITIPGHTNRDVFVGACFDQGIAEGLLRGEWPQHGKGSPPRSMQPAPPQWREEVSVSELMVPPKKKCLLRSSSDGDEVDPKMRFLKMDRLADSSIYEDFAHADGMAPKHIPPQRPATLANTSRCRTNRFTDPGRPSINATSESYVRHTELKYQPGVMRGRLEKLEKEAKDLKAIMMEKSWR